MTNNHYLILLVDDHPLITSSFQSAFKTIEKKKQTQFKIETAHSFQLAITALIKNTYDVVFLDVQMPSLESENIFSGEDLGSRIRTQHPNTKIVTVTTFNDNYRIHSIIEQISPDGFLIKNDLTPEELELAIEKVLLDPPYYSKTVIQSMRKYISNDFILDKTDRELLYYLSRGASLSAIADQLSLSRAAIAKRKQHLKEVFNVEGSENIELLEKARKKGFI
ncbi:response regulator transcription factor [Tamlana sp. 2_MG-2023]|uniref:response regulator transcription factor n=1 Tax=unclassified Tamlana TaxID=2614803 RepID=UPI0026E2B983|nr:MULTISPECIES: response regulator transcription factor [unclassified Tamlana]MDO6761884.1 response regulator transcription factor [Tamlana sp. 2_MG-2023]MDO6792646.1 response regulator transcription factor [Tamlana sp. 1_MG-2023]